MINDYLNIDNLAKKLGISKISLRRYIKSGRLKATLIGREYKILPNEAQVFINSFEKESNNTVSITTKSSHIPNLTSNLNEKLFHKPHDPHEKPHHNGLKTIPGVNSTVIESLTEMLNQHISLEEVQEIITQYAHESLELIEKIRKEGISDVHTAVTLLLVDEAIRNLQIRRLLFSRLIDKEALLILPLPPHLSDSLLTVASSEFVFTGDTVLPPHLKYARYKHLENVTVNDVSQNFKGIRAIAIEGYTENTQLYARSDIVNFIYQLANMGLEEIFIHIIPHIPPNSHFIELKTKNYPAKILKL
ncbi:helix-turn-helix domain-containing protein [Patescibacteria group bacterium]|nr:helix-turn-helix domain-containing protein [Patescibacteria group bacterium]